MKLLITKVWNWWDIWLLKWCAFLCGIAGGAYFHEYVMPYVGIVLVVAVLLTIRPAIAYWKDGQASVVLLGVAGFLMIFGVGEAGEALLVNYFLVILIGGAQLFFIAMLLSW